MSSLKESLAPGRIQTVLPTKSFFFLQNLFSNSKSTLFCQENIKASLVLSISPSSKQNTYFNYTTKNLLQLMHSLAMCSYYLLPEISSISVDL